MNRAFVEAIENDDWEYVDEHVDTQTKRTLSAAADALLNSASELQMNSRDSRYNFEHITDYLSMLFAHGLRVEDVSLSDAIVLMNLQIAEFLIDHGAPVTFQTVVDALEYGRMNSIQLAIDNASDRVLNSSNKKGDTLLHMVCVKREFDNDTRPIEALLAR